LTFTIPVPHPGTGGLWFAYVLDTTTGAVLPLSTVLATDDTVFASASKNFIYWGGANSLVLYLQSGALSEGNSATLVVSYPVSN
jgi:hypothetical protein